VCVCVHVCFLRSFARAYVSLLFVGRVFWTSITPVGLLVRKHQFLAKLREYFQEYGRATRALSKSDEDYILGKLGAQQQDVVMLEAFARCVA